MGSRTKNGTRYGFVNFTTSEEVPILASSEFERKCMGEASKAIQATNNYQLGQSVWGPQMISRMLQKTCIHTQQGLQSVLQTTPKDMAGALAEKL